VLGPGEFSLALDPIQGVAAAALRGNDALVVLDVEVTPELEAEGRARDMVRAVQQMRKDADFHPTDRIRLAHGTLPDGVLPHLDWIAREVLATEVIADPSVTAVSAYQVDGQPLLVAVSKVG
ncbi:MAG: DUF5915 domain-containing protein, partial [Actinomycetota bacterium]|nr:DUF5915 domain-containing protein [Actinomycetota bacterium]